MPAKKATTPKPAPVPAETAHEDVVAAAEIADIQPLPSPVPLHKWPIQYILRSIPVRLTEEEIIASAYRLVEAIEDYDAIEREKLTIMDALTRRGGSVEDVINTQRALIAQGSVIRPIQCRWEFEVSGRDIHGNFIPSVAHKVLIRMDTDEVIETCLITQEDRQMLFQI